MRKSGRPIARRGLSCVNVIVVMGVIALLLAFFMPALEQSRESARRTQCKNNLKQLGLALYNYHETYSGFPPGFVIDTNGVYHGWSWGIMITPYLDCSPYYNRVNFGSGLQNEYDKPHMRQFSPVFRCPSDWGPKAVEHVSMVTTNVEDGVVQPGTVDAANVFARGNYFGNAGYFHADVGGIAYDASGEPPASEPYMNAGSLGRTSGSSSVAHRYLDQACFHGLFGQNSFVKIEDIKDGTSTTLMVGERWTPREASIDAVGHGTWVGVPDCTTAVGLSASFGDTSIKLNSAFGSTTAFGSPHTGGAFFLICDGSVKFISNKIDIRTYRNTSTIDDGKKVTEFQ